MPFERPPHGLKKPRIKGYLKTENFARCFQCEGLFEKNKVVYHADETFCNNCSETIEAEEKRLEEKIKQAGIYSLDEFLNKNKLTKKIMFFAEAKYYGISTKLLKKINSK